MCGVCVFRPPELSRSSAAPDKYAEIRNRSIQNPGEVMHTNERTLSARGVTCTGTKEQRETGVRAASLAAIPLPVLVVALPPALPVRMPPTHPSVAIRALGPRVHLASSSVSVELSPTMATNKKAWARWQFRSKDSTKRARKKKRSIVEYSLN